MRRIGFNAKTPSGQDAKKTHAMDQVCAYKLLDDIASKWLEIGLEELKLLVGQTITSQDKGEDGVLYLIESKFDWKDPDQNNVAIDIMVAVIGTGPLRRIDRSIVVATK